MVTTVNNMKSWNLNFWYNACGIAKFQNKYFNILKPFALYTQINMLAHKMVLKHLTTRSRHCIHLFYDWENDLLDSRGSSSFVTLFNTMFVRQLHNCELCECNRVKSCEDFAIFVVYCLTWRAHTQVSTTHITS